MANVKRGGGSESAYWREEGRGDHQLSVELYFSLECTDYAELRRNTKMKEQFIAYRRSRHLIKKAIESYEKAVKFARTDQELASVHKNLGKAYIHLCKLEENNIKEQLSASQLAFKHLSISFNYGVEHYGDQWLQGVLDTYSSMLRDKMVLIRSYDIDTRDKIVWIEKVDNSSKNFPVAYLRELCLVELCNVLLDSSFLSLDLQEFGAALGAVQEAHIYLSELQQLSPGHPIISEITERIKTAQCQAAAMQIIKKADGVLKEVEATYPEGDSVEALYEVIDWYTKAIQMSEKNDTDTAAEAYNRLGRIFKDVMKDEERAKNYFNQSKKLAEESRRKQQEKDRHKSRKLLKIKAKSLVSQPKRTIPYKLQGDLQVNRQSQSHPKQVMQSTLIVPYDSQKNTKTMSTVTTTSTQLGDTKLNTDITSVDKRRLSQEQVINRKENEIIVINQEATVAADEKMNGSSLNRKNLNSLETEHMQSDDIMDKFSDGNIEEECNCQRMVHDGNIKQDEINNKPVKVTGCAGIPCETHISQRSLEMKGHQIELEHTKQDKKDGCINRKQSTGHNTHVPIIKQPHQKETWKNREEQPRKKTFPTQQKQSQFEQKSDDGISLPAGPEIALRDKTAVRPLTDVHSGLPNKNECSYSQRDKKMNKGGREPSIDDRPICDQAMTDVIDELNNMYTEYKKDKTNMYPTLLKGLYSKYPPRNMSPEHQFTSGEIFAMTDDECYMYTTNIYDWYDPNQQVDEDPAWRYICSQIRNIMDDIYGIERYKKTIMIYQNARRTDSHKPRKGTTWRRYLCCGSNKGKYETTSSEDNVL